MKKMIVFVCNGNIHRSVIAAESLKIIFKKNKIFSNFVVISRGLQGTCGVEFPKHKNLFEYKKEWMAAIPTLKKLNIDITKNNFKKISISIIQKADLIIAMDNKVYLTASNSLLNQFPKYKNKIYLFSKITSLKKEIKDPAGSEDRKLHQEIIENIYFTLKKKYKNILKKLYFPEV